MTEQHLKTANYTRRIPVRELRPSGWRTRIADHATESGLNPITEQLERMRHDTCDCMIWFMLRLMAIYRGLCTWKRDVKRACKRVPVKAAHRDLAGANLVVNGIWYVSNHTGMLFGATSAGAGWHRMVNLPMAILRAVVRVLLGRYVDDLFGADSPDCEVDGGMCVDVVFQLFGIPLDPKKSFNFTEAMSLLGILLRPDPAAGVVHVSIEEEKARRWSAELQHIETAGRWDPTQAGKMAGRLSFACCVAAGKKGRGYIGASHAQQHDPLPLVALSIRMRRSLHFWRWYLEERPPTLRHVQAGHRARTWMWADAACLSRGLGVVLYAQERWWYTTTKTPEKLIRDLLPRKDNQINFQEMLAMVIGLTTFITLLQGSLLLTFCDNDGVRAATQKASGGSPEVAHLVSHVWKTCALRHVVMYVARVESHANVADAPSRHDFQGVSALRATFVPAVLPASAQDIWAGDQPVA